MIIRFRNNGLLVSQFERKNEAKMNDLIKTKGIVTEIIDLTTFQVRLNNETVIVVTISNKLKKPLDFDIYVGEEMPINMSIYDRTRGRINTQFWERTKP